MKATDLKFYNKGISRQDISWNVQLFAEHYQVRGQTDAPLTELNQADLDQIFVILRKCILDSYFLAFAGEQKGLVDHILDCLNEDLREYYSTIKKAAISRDDSEWDAVVKIMTSAYHE